MRSLHRMQYTAYVFSCCTTLFHPCDFVRHFPVLQISVLQIQLSLKYAKNALAAGAPPLTPLGELTTPPGPLVGWGGGHPLPIPQPLSADGASILPPLPPVEV